MENWKSAGYRRWRKGDITLSIQFSYNAKGYANKEIWRVFITLTPETEKDPEFDGLWTKNTLYKEFGSLESANVFVKSYMKKQESK